MTAFEALLDSPNFSHIRVASWRADGYVKDDTDLLVRVYHREPTSPTGVLCAGGGQFVDVLPALQARKLR